MLQSVRPRRWLRAAGGVATRMLAPLVLAGAIFGCQDTAMDPFAPRPAAATTQPVPGPINLLLPKSIRIHPLTGGPRPIDESGSTRGLEVQIAVADAYGHAAKAFGEFRFELYLFKANSADTKGARIAVWEVSTLGPRANRDYWVETRRMYEFRLQWNQDVPLGQKLVLEATFSSPFTPRMFSQHTFIAGE